MNAKRSVKNDKPIYRFERLQTFDKWAIALYVALTCVLTYYFLIVALPGTKQSIIGIYAMGTPLCLYMVCYKSLRNLTVYCIWFFFGLVHFLVYLKLKEDTALEMVRGHAATPLRNTIPLLLLYQLLRFASVKIQGQEFVVPNKVSQTDMFGERQPTWVDTVCLVVFWSGLLFLSMYN